MTRPQVAICHDHLTQRGGAERVVLAMHRAYPDAPVYTALFEPSRTYPDFASMSVRPHAMNAVAALRRNHRLSLPVTAPAFSSMCIDADVTVCSSSGWSHGVRATGRKVVYCHSPARWLYRTEDYLRHFGATTRVGLRALAPALRRWDRRAMRDADVIAVNSEVIAAQVRGTYGRDPVVIAPASPLADDTAVAPVPGLVPGFVLCVSRLLGYKHLDVLMEAARAMPATNVVIVGDGPLRGRLSDAAPPNVTLLGVVSDEQLRWCYRSCCCLVSTSEEDFGLTPVEAAGHGRPSVVPRARGYLDHVVDGCTGVFHDGTVDGLRAALARARSTQWDRAAIRRHAERYGVDVFTTRLAELVETVA